jgi:hypothetical protein
VLYKGVIATKCRVCKYYLLPVIKEQTFDIFWKKTMREMYIGNSYNYGTLLFL